MIIESRNNFPNYVVVERPDSNVINAYATDKPPVNVRESIREREITGRPCDCAALIRRQVR